MLCTGVAAVACRYDTRHRGAVALHQNLGRELFPRAVRKYARSGSRV